MDQVVALLSNGADYAYLIRPEPKTKRESDHVKMFFRKRAPDVGIYFVTSDLGFDLIRNAKRNPDANEYRKLKMLTYVTTTASVIKKWEETRIPDWAFPYPC